MRSIKIGLTESHGMALEQSQFPPDGIEYQFLRYKHKDHYFFKSPIKGFMSSYDDEGCDAVEAILTPARTTKPWFYSLACFQEAVAFSIKGFPIPRRLRCAYAENLFSKQNFKKFLFWSEAGKKTLESYGNISNPLLLKKAEVVYPGIRKVSPQFIRYKSTDLQLLFNGNFFIKGGVNVVDAFELLQKEFPTIKLRVCCDENIDFHTGDSALRKKYLDKIRINPNIEMGRVKRDVFINHLLPNTDIYVLPTYGDAFGFAVLEAMSYGIPVVSTNYMAIPEMVVHGKTGFMANISDYDCPRMFKGCYVETLPNNFSSSLTRQIYKYLRILISSKDKREYLGMNAIDVAQAKFSFSNRAKKMERIYKETLSHV